MTSRFLATPLPLTSSRRLIEPFLPIAKASIWSPLDIFAPQRLERFERDNRQEDFPDTGDEEVQNEAAKANIRANYNRIVTDLLTFLGGDGETTLREFLAYETEQAPDFAGEKQFYLFWMILHRRQQLIFDGENYLGDSPYRTIAETHPELTELSVSDADGLIENDAYTISNMTIKVVTNHGI